jgi:serine O-acetyltransferase
VNVSLAAGDLTAYLGRQLANMFPDGSPTGDLRSDVDAALARLDHSLTRTRVKYFSSSGQATFSHLHTDQYAMFLYLAGRAAFVERGDTATAAKLYALNKALHAIDVFYEVELPQIFAFQHPVGTVLGRATYGDYFFVYQRCSVGSSLATDYPVIGSGVVMFGGSAIIGRSTIGANSWLSVGATVMDQEVPGNAAVFGRSPDLVIKPTRRNVVRDLFGCAA